MSQRRRKSAGHESGREPDETVMISGGLIWIDARPLLKEEQTKLRLSKRKLSVAEERLKLHKQSDEPQYQNWFNVTFSERLGEIRGLYEKLAELDSIVWKVEREILATGCTAAEAYDAVLEAIAEDARLAAAAVAANEESAQRANKKSESSDSEDFSSESSSDKSEAFEPWDDGDEPWKATKKSATASSKREKAAEDLIKQIYRSLVRKLHPDLNPDLSDTLRERWFDVQQAYEDRDLTRLEMLLAACEEGDAGDAAPDDSFIDKIQSLSRLRLLLKSMAKKLKASQKQLAQAKNQPAWEFHQIKKDPRRLAWLERNVKFELRGAEETLSSDIRTLQAQIDRWQRPSRPRTSRRNKKDWNLQFDF
jgi:hypothetical protein